jgi:hypothetical protein
MSEIEPLNTEEKILEAAKRVFVRKGFDGARMQEIADEAGINKALLHYYFRSKDKLFTVIFDETLGQLTGTIHELLNSSDNIFELIDKFVDFYTDFLKKNPHVPIFILNEIYQNPERMKQRIEKNGIFPKPMDIAIKFSKQAENGEIKEVNPIYFVLNMISMCIFPFMARPMIQTVFKVNDPVFDFMLDDRKTFIKETLINSIKK